MGRSKGGGKKGGGGMKGFLKQTQAAKQSLTESISSSSDSASTKSDEEEKPTTADQKALEIPEPKDIKNESRSELRDRHKKEMAAAKRTATNMGKKKKQEAAAFLESVKKRHEAEIKAIKQRMEHTSDHSDNDEPSELTVTKEDPVTIDSKKSKSKKRREKAGQKMEEREARIREDIEKLGATEKDTEEQILKERLSAIGCTIHEIRPDGHCLYNALRDQLCQTTDNSMDVSCEHLRKLAAQELRDNADQYLPFFVAEEIDEPEVESVSEAFEEHCNRVESTAQWGGELEIEALSRKLERKVIIYSVDLGEKIVGETFVTEPLLLCFMRHAYQLGAHYNSVRSIV